MQREPIARVPWKRYIIAVTETVITFTLASFLFGLYLLHRGDTSVTVLLAMVYAFVVIFSIYRMVRTFSLAAVMLMVPIAPFVVLMIVVSLIHLLQYFK
jgi:hypothetical protein